MWPHTAPVNRPQSARENARLIPAKPHHRCGTQNQPARTPARSRHGRKNARAHPPQPTKKPNPPTQCGIPQPVDSQSLALGKPSPKPAAPDRPISTANRYRQTPDESMPHPPEALQPTAPSSSAFRSPHSAPPNRKTPRIDSSPASA